MKTINCERFIPLDYEFALEKGQHVTLFNGTKGTVLRINKPYIDLKLDDGREEPNIHWLNIKIINALI